MKSDEMVRLVLALVVGVVIYHVVNSARKGGRCDSCPGCQDK